jgi:2,3-diketo-5-methylthio-1-phosphopentane phosphatase
MPQLHVFSDFDGTIATEDLGDKLFVEFGRFDAMYPHLQNGELSIAQYWQEVCATLKSGLTLERIRAWAWEQPADVHFRSFVEFCRHSNIPLDVASDGFDAYIVPVLKREGAADVRVWCNHLKHFPSGFQPVFWGADESCTCFCASCKRNALLQAAHPDALIVYIGDGYSDFCAAEHADIIFAKKTLAAHCNAHRIPHYPFTSFADVLSIMQTLVTKKRLKPRHQAVLRRKEAFATE